MSKFTWNKKALAGITIAALAGVLSPISASAWEEGEPDEIVTATVDLGSGNGGGGGGGGGTDTCTGYSSLDLPTNVLSLTYQTTRAKNPLVTSWEDDPATDGNDQNSTLDDDTVEENFEWDDLNTQRDYVSEELEIAFDANNCVGSEDWAELDFERMPVERAVVAGGWNVAEMAWEHYELGAGVNRANADLVLDRGLVNGNVNTVRVFDHIWTESDIDNGSVDSIYYSDWGTIWDDLNPLQEPQGTSGVANVRAILTLFGEEAKGKYRVKYGVDLWID
jgi:hypothetical protein